jgi:hypothetical protein
VATLPSNQSRTALFCVHRFPVTPPSTTLPVTSAVYILSIQDHSVDGGGGGIRTPVYSAFIVDCQQLIIYIYINLFLMYTVICTKIALHHQNIHEQSHLQSVEHEDSCHQASYRQEYGRHICPNRIRHIGLSLSLLLDPL